MKSTREERERDLCGVVAVADQSQSMGTGSSKGTKLKRKMLTELVQSTPFNETQITELFKHFRSISATDEDDGLLNKREFCKALGVEPNLFYDRMFAIFDKDRTGFIDFREFVMGMAIFAASTPIEEKLKFSFQVYDQDGDGFVKEEELVSLLEAVFQENRLALTSEQVKRLVMQTFAEADVTCNGRISFSEYKRMVERHPSILELMTIGGIMTKTSSSSSSFSSAAAASSAPARHSVDVMPRRSMDTLQAPGLPAGGAMMNFRRSVDVPRGAPSTPSLF